MYFADLEALEFEMYMVCLVIMCVLGHTLVSLSLTLHKRDLLSLKCYPYPQSTTVKQYLNDMEFGMSRLK